MYPDVLCTSVPLAEQAELRRLLPGATVTHEPVSEELGRRFPQMRWLCVMVHDSVPPDVLSWWPSLRAVVTRSTGFDHLPLVALEHAKVGAYSLTDYAVGSVAQLAVTQIVSLLRRIPEATAVTRAGSWSRAGLVGRNVADCRVGVWGVGRIGSEVARGLLAAGADVIGHDMVRSGQMERLAGFRYVDPLDAFLTGLDVLTIHLPLTDATRGVVNARALQHLSHGAVLVNTARGEIVNQAAVEQMLRSGALGGYAADVLPLEPHVPDISRFREFTNILLTPHLGAYDGRSIAARYQEAARIIRSLVGDEQERIEHQRVL